MCPHKQSLAEAPIERSALLVASSCGLALCGIGAGVKSFSVRVFMHPVYFTWIITNERYRAV